MNIEEMINEACRLDTQEKIDKFNEAARKIFCDKDYFEGDDIDILKCIEGEPITDNRERRLHDPSIYRYHGRQVLHTFFDEPYPVMMPEDVKTMRGVSDEIMRKLYDELNPLPMGINIQRVMSAKYLLANNSVPDTVREEAEREALLYGDSYIYTAAVRNFKQELGYRRLQFVEDIIQSQIRSLSEELMGNMPTRKYLIPPRSRRSMKDNQLSIMVLLSMLKIDMSAKLDLDSVIHIHWPKQDLSNLKAHDFRYGKMWEDNPLINYATGDISPIDKIILDSLSTFGPDINSGYGMSTPNLNEFDKKKLERIIKRRKRNDKPRKRR